MASKKILHYRILEELGWGGMDLVFKAKDIKPDRTFALKFLPPHLYVDDEAEKRFSSEVKLLSPLIIQTSALFLKLVKQMRISHLSFT